MTANKWQLLFYGNDLDKAVNAKNDDTSHEKEALPVLARRVRDRMHYFLLYTA